MTTVTYTNDEHAGRREHKVVGTPAQREAVAAVFCRERPVTVVGYADRVEITWRDGLRVAP